MIKVATEMSLSDKNRMEMLVVVRKRGLLWMIKQVNTFQKTAESINTTGIKEPAIISSVVKYLVAFLSQPLFVEFALLFTMWEMIPKLDGFVDIGPFLKLEAMKRFTGAMRQLCLFEKWNS